MGAFTSALASQDMNCVGLFLIALPVAIPNYARAFDVRRVPTALVHGWDDELCPVDDAIAFARARGDAITLVSDDHRLGAHVDFIAQIFAQFLRAVRLTCAISSPVVRKDSNIYSSTNSKRSARRMCTKHSPGVYFKGGLEIGYRACLWSRLASRIFMPIVGLCGRRRRSALRRRKGDRIGASILPDGTTFAIDAVGSTPGVTHTSIRGVCASKTLSSISSAKQTANGPMSIRKSRSAHQPRAAQRQGDRQHRSVRRAAASARLSRRHRARAAQGKPRRRDAAARGMAGDLCIGRRTRRSAVRLRHARHRSGDDGRRCRARLAARTFRIRRLERPRCNIVENAA